MLKIFFKKLLRKKLYVKVIRIVKVMMQIYLSEDM